MNTIRALAVFAVLVFTLCHFPAIGEEISKSHMKAAEKLCKITKAKDQCEALAQTMRESLFKADVGAKYPGFNEAYADIIINWTEKYISWDNMKDEIINMYAEEFSEKEINEMIAFYKTPLGEKIISSMPILINKGNQLGQQIARENLKELQDAMQKLVMQYRAK